MGNTMVGSRAMLRRRLRRRRGLWVSCSSRVRISILVDGLGFGGQRERERGRFVAAKSAGRGRCQKVSLSLLFNLLQDVSMLPLKGMGFRGLIWHLKSVFLPLFLSSKEGHMYGLFLISLHFLVFFRYQVIFSYDIFSPTSYFSSLLAYSSEPVLTSSF
jgi:hypothetical protein